MIREDFDHLIRDKVRELEKVSKNSPKTTETMFTDKIKELGKNFLRDSKK